MKATYTADLMRCISKQGIQFGDKQHPNDLVKGDCTMSLKHVDSLLAHSPEEILALEHPLYVLKAMGLPIAKNLDTRGDYSYYGTIVLPVLKAVKEYLSI